MAYIDFSKAFDTVKREKLWEILRRLSISTKFLKMLQAIYKSVKECVRYGATVTEVFNCPMGLRQGSILSSILFSLLINVVANEINIFWR